MVRTLEMLGEDLARAGPRRCATPRRRAASPCRCRPIPKSGWRCFPRQAGTGDPRIRARRRAYRHRRHAGPDARAHLPQAWHRLHHLLPHPLSRICACALSASCRRSWSMRWLRWFHGPATAMMVATATPEARNGGARLSAICASGRAAWMSNSSIPIAGRAPALSRADLALCRPGGGRKEYRGLPGARSARHQGRGGRRPGRERAGSANIRTPNSWAR